MDFLNMLSGLFTTTSSVDALSAKTGTDSNQTKGILSAALPMLFSALTSNASSKEGATSLLGALSQHTSTAAMEDQIANADEEDGGKIIGHILGDKKQEVLQAISQKTGADAKQINALLSNIAPGMLSGISAATSAATKKLSGDKNVAAAKLAKDKAAATGKLSQAKTATVSSDSNAAKAKAAAAKLAAAKIKEAAEEEVKETAEQSAAPGLDLSGLMGLLGGGGSSNDNGGGLGGLLGGLGGLFGGGADDDKKEASGGGLLGALSSLFK